ncbi:glycine betaine/proline transport system substrate-binding protein [Lentibacillus persicus]|uniref:Glycine betaine/proline transport system substrate-binding protein n=1 Tax=Lentibacillus persicus TaxID=640948 RepID=A0A1I1Z133_9BACI|nr:glycine betaine ABC transporter substrate-binding protein [Lentibacillus persicus]SFE24123.1 glycine betaine/proline transport system substrate-binding protein [Lentibacillus persicus]
MKKMLFLLAAILLAVVMYGCTSSNESEGASDDSEASNESGDSQAEKPTLTFGKTPWTSTVPPTEIAKIILEDMGYTVNEKEANLGVVFTGLSENDVNIFMDYWEPQHEQYLEKYSDSVKIVSTSYGDADWGMAVPEYMEDINDVGDLKGKEDSVNNEVLAIEESDPAVKDIPKAVDAYNLDLEMINSSEAAMLAATEEKIKNEEPVVLFGWRPHSMFNKFDIKLLTNEKIPEVLGSSAVHVVANKELEKEAPEAYEFISNWSMPIDDLEEMITKIDNGENPEEVAQTWIDNNQDKIDKMKGE